MAGTNRSRASDIGAAAALDPVIILVRPQLGENIGTAARAMLNCGLSRLRLVAPRNGWPDDKARAAASGADGVIERAELFADLPAAVADLNRVIACTARPRDMVHRLVAPPKAAEEMRGWAAQGERCGVMFGPERSGLTNEDLGMAEAILTIPLNPAYASLNLAQAVLLVAYEWSRTSFTAPGELMVNNELTRPATKDELTALFEHLERELDDSGFLRIKEKRPSMVRNIRSALQRAQMTEQEVRTFHGIIKELSQKRKPPA